MAAISSRLQCVKWNLQLPKSSNDLQWLDLHIKHQESSPSNDHQGDSSGPLGLLQNDTFIKFELPNDKNCEHNMWPGQVEWLLTTSDPLIWQGHNRKAIMLYEAEK